MTGASALYVGHVMHRRTRPRAHRLRYRIFSLLLDLDEIDLLARRSRLFSRNRFNLFAFYDRDYAGASHVPLRAQVERHLASADMDLGGGPIRLLTMPRILGFAFNPLSVYFCHDRAGALRAILYEVNNTFGQRHSYLLPVDQQGAVRQACAKRFHVSPFLGLDMRYAFRVNPPDARLSIAIIGSDRDGPVITAVHSARRRPLTDAALLRVFATHPLLTLKVVGGIAWEALRLWAKGVPVQHRPPPPPDPVTTAATPKEVACI
ncbi:DUF1365 domain-containing protein [Sphingomonas oryzagri]|uniref:DUF1365 family protein n=1 Tax=Sphingomonas oryzagri TaxID=3042314 RepID=A0ABT6N292_9SPHN|nr:DUF1365 family protein [Sphingomonas oryzagri]MDH7639352.1 DUF1365 family protein [Sphingomonas oryzagri]